MSSTQIIMDMVLAWLKTLIYMQNWWIYSSQFLIKSFEIKYKFTCQIKSIQQISLFFNFRIFALKFKTLKSKMLINSCLIWNTKIRWIFLYSLKKETLMLQSSPWFSFSICLNIDEKGIIIAIDTNFRM